MKKSIILLLVICLMVLPMTGCSSPEGEQSVNSTIESTDFSVLMVADVGGVNDQSYNQAAWEGLQKLEEETDAKVSYIETIQTSDLSTNFDRAVDEGHNLIWAIGFNTAEQLKPIAEINPEQTFAIVDHDFGDENLDNVACAVFNVEEASFLVGYIAGLTTKTDHVGYIGGMRSPTMDLFEYGYKAGVDYAAEELEKDIKVSVQIAETFTDAAKGKAIAASMYNSGCDIIFPAAGATGSGAIEQAEEENKLVIGVDLDQSYLAPNNVLTSALKNVGVATCALSKEMIEGTNIGGQTYEFDLANGGVGIPEKNSNMDPEVYEKAMEVRELIINGEIVPPYSEKTYNEFN